MATIFPSVLELGSLSVLVRIFSLTQSLTVAVFLGLTDDIRVLFFAEMASTGEVASFGQDIHEAYWASLLSTTGFKIPKANSGVLIGGDVTKPEMKSIAQTLTNLCFKLYCSSPEVEEFITDIPYVNAKRIFFPTRDKPKLREVFDEYDIQCVINLAKARGKSAVDEDYVARR